MPAPSGAPTLLLCVASFATGLAGALLVSGPASAGPRFLARPGHPLLLALAAGLSTLHGGGPAAGAWMLRLALLACAAAGAALGAVAAAGARSDCRARIPDRSEVTGRAVLEALPAADGSGMLRLLGARASGAGESVDDGSDRAQAGGSCRGLVRARLSPTLAGGAVPAGTELTIAGRWVEWPPEGAVVARPERTGILLLEEIEAVPGGRDFLVYRLRSGAQRRLRRLFGPRAAMAEALLLARREGLDPELRDRFARAGMAHLLAISGLHVGVIAGVLLLIARGAGVPPGRAAGTAAALTVLYVGGIGFPHAAVRASVQAALFLIARWLQRPSHPFALLAAAALAILVPDPLALADPGFQLSFAGIGGILWLRPRLLAAWPRRAGWVVGPARDALVVSVAASAATAPVAAWHFGLSSPIGVAVNLVAIPVAAAAVPAAALALGASLLAEPIGAFLAGGAEVLLRSMDVLATAATAVPGGHRAISRGEVAGWIAAISGGALAGPRLVRWSTARAGPPGGTARDARRLLRLRRLRRVATTVVASALLIVWPILPTPWRAGRIEIHAIDVGQGDAFAVRTPTGRWLLIDSGPRTERFDAGRARVVPHLLRNGARSVEVLLLTHPDGDHIGGAAAVLSALPVRTVMEPARATGKPLYLDLLHAGSSEGVAWIAGRAGTKLTVDGVRIDVLAPTDSLLDAPSGDNDISLVLRLSYGRFAVLFTGDAPYEVERALVRGDAAALRVHVLKVGHHGSHTSTSEEFLRAAAPELALIGVGRHNRYGHPHATVLARLERHGARILRTDRHGSVTVIGGASGRWRVRTSR